MTIRAHFWRIILFLKIVWRYPDPMSTNVIDIQTAWEVANIVWKDSKA